MAEEKLDQPTAEIYAFLTEPPPELKSLTMLGGGTAMRFTLKHTKLITLLARIPIGLVGAALTTIALIEEFRPTKVVQVGFGGILSDDLRLGDITVASQVDCYLVRERPLHLVSPMVPVPRLRSQERSSVQHIHSFNWL